MRSGFKFICHLFLLFGMAVLASAQDFRATITGQVSDTSGSILPGAVVTARHTATNAIYKTQAGDDGEYALRNLEPGEYVITVEKDGFLKLSREGVILQVAGQ